MDKILQAISDEMPKINQELLVGFVENSIGDSVHYVDTAFKGAVQLVPGAVSYKGYEILGPRERVIAELDSKKIRICLATSELQLVEFRLEHQGTIHPCKIYVPYMHNRMLHIRGKRYSVNLGISEQVYSRVQDKGVDGLMVRPIRARITFNRKDIIRLVDYRTRAVVASPFVVTVKLHHKRHNRRKIDTSVILYLLCKFGLKNTLIKLGIDPNMISFVDQPDYNDRGNAYILAKKPSKNDNLFLKVDYEELASNRHLAKIIGSIIYTLNISDNHSIDEFWDPSGSMWRVILGRIIYPDAPGTKARTDADTHIQSVDIFIDPISRKRFNDFGVHVQDIYELLIYTFSEIDTIMVNSTSQNLYDKRVDITDGVMIPSFVTTIYQRFYRTNQRTQLRDREVKALVKIRPMVIDQAWSSARRGSPRNITTAPQMFNDSWLASCGIFKIRAAGSADQRFHPSMAVVESLVAFSGANVGQTGLINPYLQINPKTGGIIRPNYAEDIDVIEHYLPQG